jgi:hypothetical protein
MSTFSLRKLALGVAVVAGSTVATGPANAAPLEREHYSGTDSFSFDDCGFLIEGTTTFSGVFMLKEGRGGDATPYVFDNYSHDIVYTNPATGAWFTLHGEGLYKDLHIVNVEGTVYRFESMEVGQPFVIRDSAGNVVVRDRGRLLTAFTVDTLGDDNLENDIFIDGSFELLADNGRHPGFYTDFCDIAVDLIG